MPPLYFFLFYLVATLISLVYKNVSYFFVQVMKWHYLVMNSHFVPLATKKKPNLQIRFLPVLFNLKIYPDNNLNMFSLQLLQRFLQMYHISEPEFPYPKVSPLKQP